MVRVEEIGGEVKVTVKSVFKDVVSKDVCNSLLVRGEHDVNLLSLVISHLSLLIRVESRLVLIVLKQVVFALVELPVWYKVSFPRRV